jgi:uncharacterized protein
VTVGGPVTDVHVHVQPREMLRPEVREAFRHGKDADVAERCMHDPAALLASMDAAGVERMVLINYESPDVMGFTKETHDWVLAYCRAAPDRLLPCVGPNPRFEKDVAGEARRLVDAGARLFKVHGPHMGLRANAYLDEVPGLADLYRVAEETDTPVMFHTGTSIFRGARIKYGDPVQVDDVGVDFPRMRVVLAHGGRPFWTEASWFLLRRFRSFHLDVSGIPPRRLLEWFPRLEEISDRVLFGTDWPSPGVPPVAQNLQAIRALPLGTEAVERIVSGNALRLLPPR